MNMTFHEYADLFPLMLRPELDSLKTNINEQGLLEPIWTYQGQILDGRNRWRACEELGIEPQVREYHGDDPLGFVIAMNLHRRHLDESQRAMVAARMANMERGVNQHTQICVPSIAESATKLNVSERSVNTAKAVQRDGIPELIAAVDDGRVAVSKAATIAKLPEEEQNEIVKTPHVFHNSGNNEWYTPPEIIAAAKMVMDRIDIDPASSEIANRIVGADTFYTKKDDSLSIPWKGKVWMNPPYAAPLVSKFADKLCAERTNENIKEAIVLVNNATETKWFQQMAFLADSICFPEKRIRFLDENGNLGAPLQGQAILYFGGFASLFREIFTGFGFIAGIAHVNI